MGSDGLPGGERDHSAGRRLHDDVHRAQEVLYDLRRAVRHQLRDVRAGSYAASSGLLPRAAGHRRRRAGSVGAGHSRRYFSSGEARAGVCDVWACRSVCACDRTYAWRLYHRSLRLAMDLLPQHSGLHSFAISYFANRRRSTVGEEAGGDLAEGRHQARFHRLRSAWANVRVA